LSAGQELELVVDDIGALKDVPALVHKTGDKIISTKEEGEKITFIIKKS
jgi:TusA-related sulfurtransferase